MLCDEEFGPANVDRKTKLKYNNFTDLFLCRMYMRLHKDPGAYADRISEGNYDRK